MRARFLILGTALALLVPVSGAWAQSGDAPPAQSKGIDAALLLAKAQRGDPNAEFQLGTRLMTGSGVPQNIEEAMVEFQKAAEKGNSDAQYLLGQIYDDGGLSKGVPGPDGTYRDAHVTDFHAAPQNSGLAAKWYRRAAEQGNSLAQNHLGSMYADGRGVPQDYAEAYFWLSLASASGSHSSTNGIDDRDLAASHLTKTVQLETQATARRWFAAHQAKMQ
jgi:uncharacterized protein